MENHASDEARRMSVAHTRSTPPPTQAECTADITGFGHLTQARVLALSGAEESVSDQGLDEGGSQQMCSRLNQDGRTKRHELFSRRSTAVPTPPNNVISPHGCFKGSNYVMGAVAMNNNWPEAQNYFWWHAHPQRPTATRCTPPCVPV